MGFISLLLLFILYLIVKTLLLNFIFIGSFINLINLIPITLLDGYGILRGSIKHINGLVFYNNISYWVYAGGIYVYSLFYYDLFSYFRLA